MRNVFDYPDDRQPGILWSWQAERESFANRIVIGEVALRQGFVDDRCGRSIGGVAFCEITPGDDWDAQCVKVIRRDQLPACHGRVVEIERSPLDYEGIVACNST